MNVNKRRSRTAVFSVNRAQTILIEHTPNHFKLKLLIDKKVLMETWSEEFGPVALENYEF